MKIMKNDMRSFLEALGILTMALGFVLLGSFLTNLMVGELVIKCL